MRHIIYWRGEGWYASRQEGAYENTAIITAWVGGVQEWQPENTSAGTPRWYESLEEMKEANPDASIE